MNKLNKTLYTMNSRCEDYFEATIDGDILFGSCDDVEVSELYDDPIFIDSVRESFIE